MLPLSPAETSEPTPGADTVPTTRLSGRLAWVRISTQQVGEGFAHLLLPVGDMGVGAGAYSRAKQRLAVAKAGALGLVRYSTAPLPL
jgi:hypothetical protein